MITHIIWDYNGTVVDDVDASVAAVNEMLRVRNLPPTTKQIYIDTVSLPLENYYSNLGIKNADMSSLSCEFRDYCEKYNDRTRIFSAFYAAAEYAKQINIKNILMSSLYTKFLLEEVEKYNISEYFDEIIGMDNTLVGTKLENAKNYLNKNKICPENVLFIGDLINDAQIAKKIGANCVLIPNGHNSKQRCLSQGVTVLEDLGSLIQYLNRT